VPASSVGRGGDEELPLPDLTSVFGNQRLERGFCCRTTERPWHKRPRASLAQGRPLPADTGPSPALVSRRPFRSLRWHDSLPGATSVFCLRTWEFSPALPHRSGTRPIPRISRALPDSSVSCPVTPLLNPKQGNVFSLASRKLTWL